MTNFEQNQPEEIELTFAERVRNSLRKFWRTVKYLAHIERDSDPETAIQSITSSIEFKGINLWILAIAILIASIGLNVNSTAVIIGAMLISPLMGPINGIGLGIGIMDEKLLKKSLKNLGLMVVVSLIVSTLYFILTPLNEARSELLARTSPTLFDVLIAFFGGLAGIISIAHKKPSLTVISGVAIATALMPPLCTAGYSLGTLQFRYFFGAIYLFFINTVFIALATFLIVRYLHFPYKIFVNPQQKKIVKRSISLFVIIVLIPSIFFAIQVVNETSFNSNVSSYLAELSKSPLMDETQIISAKKEFSRKQSSVTLTLFGKELSKNEIFLLQNDMENFGLKKTRLIVKQTENAITTASQSELLEQMLKKKDRQIQRKDSLIESLQQSILPVNTDSNLLRHVSKEMMVQYPFVQTFSVSNAIYTNPHTQQSDTIPTALITWKNKPNESAKQQMRAWLQIRLDLDTLIIVE